LYNVIGHSSDFIKRSSPEFLGMVWARPALA
jgi:hypothetical protein